jgi:hypothetical protein
MMTRSSQFPRTVGLVAFPEDEARAIQQLVDSFPEEDHRIIQIIQRGPDELEVWTGQQLSALCGGGRVIEVRRQGSRWVADQDNVGMWVS